MIKRDFYLKATLALLMVSGFVLNSSAYAAGKYRVGIQVFHLGELIANPMLDVVADETTGGDFSVEGQHRYRIVVLVRPMNDEKVSVSLQFSSGKINIQPNLLVDIGEEASATIDKTILKLIVQKVADPDQSGVIAP